MTFHISRRFQLQWPRVSDLREAFPVTVAIISIDRGGFLQPLHSSLRDCFERLFPVVLALEDILLGLRASLRGAGCTAAYVVLTLAVRFRVLVLTVTGKFCCVTIAIWMLALLILYF